jgi:biotin/methionine sulfoxide reductase
MDVAGAFEFVFRAVVGNGQADLLGADTAPGVAVLPTGAWLTRGQDGADIAGNPNVLTLDIGSSAFGQGCAAHTCLIRVAPHAGDNRDAIRAYQSQLAEILPEGARTP